MLMNNKEWTQKDTAHDLQISLGAVSEGICLAVELRKDEHLTELSRNAALKRIRKIGE